MIAIPIATTPVPFFGLLRQPRFSAIDAADCLEQHQRFADSTYIMYAEHLHALAGEGQGYTDAAIRAIGRLVVQNLPDKALPRMTDQERMAKVMKPLTMCGEREVVLVCFAEANAGV